MHSETHEQDVLVRERDGVAPRVRLWQPQGPARAAIVVAHGMGEHSARYRAPFAPLVASGIAVYAIDHRGHGRSALAPETLGDFGSGGFAGVVDDLAALVEQVRAAAPSLPLLLFGHSMGSMIAQAYVLARSDRIDGLILCGSVAVDVVAAAAAKDPAIFAAVNTPFEPGRTGFEWLSRDTAEVDAYVADPDCGFPLAPHSFASLLAAGPELADPGSIGAIRKDLPISIISGDEDPLVSWLHGLAPLVARYREAGLSPTVRLYPGARHEILNETNRAEVVEDLKRWVEDRIGETKRPGAS